MTAAESFRLMMSALTDTNHDTAIVGLSRACEEDTTAILPAYHMATILAARGLHEQAITILGDLVAYNAAEDPAVRFLYARQLQLSGRIAEATAEYAEVLRRDPICEKAHLYLAQLYLTAAPPNRDAARIHAIEAARLRPATSMIPQVEFRRLLESLDTEWPTSDASDHLEEEYRSMALGELLLLHPRVTEVLESSGIMCSDCAGYREETLETAARESRCELTHVVHRLTLLVSNGIEQ